jgi:hypothetical protein
MQAPKWKPSKNCSHGRGISIIKNILNKMTFNLKLIALVLVLGMGLMSNKCTTGMAGRDYNANKNNIYPLEEQQQPLSYFNIYRGNSHSHSIFTWTHGAHREKPVRDLDDPTPFHSDWNVPSGMDWKDYKIVSFKPEDYTNRQGLPENHFDLAIKNGYDFYAITDHSQEPTLQPVATTNAAWQATLKAAEKYSEHPGFVALAGFEYSRNTTADGGNGHINVINSSEYVNADHGQRGPAPVWPEANWSIPQFYDWVKEAPPNGTGYVMVGFNHPRPDQYDDWAHIDDEIVELISTFEIHTNYGQPRWDAYIRALNKGWKVSPIGVHDNHGFSQITNSSNPPPTFVLAPELTKEAITRAMRHRRTFASWNEGVELRYAVNGSIMGSTLDKTETYHFEIEIKTRPSNPTERVRRIQVLRGLPDGEGVEEAASITLDGDKDEVVWKPVIRDSAAKYFLLRIYHNNDVAADGGFKPHGSTVSAPVWTGR